MTYKQIRRKALPFAAVDQSLAMRRLPYTVPVAHFVCGSLHPAELL